MSDVSPKHRMQTAGQRLVLEVGGGGFPGGITEHFLRKIGQKSRTIIRILLPVLPDTKAKKRPKESNPTSARDKEMACD